MKMLIIIAIILCIFASLMIIALVIMEYLKAKKRHEARMIEYAKLKRKLRELDL